MGLHHTRKIILSKGNHQQKRQPTKSEKLFANHMFDNGLISKVYK